MKRLRSRSRRRASRRRELRASHDAAVYELRDRPAGRDFEDAGEAVTDGRCRHKQAAVRAEPCRADPGRVRQRVQSEACRDVPQSSRAIAARGHEQTAVGENSTQVTSSSWFACMRGSHWRRPRRRPCRPHRQRPRGARGAERDRLDRGGVSQGSQQRRPASGAALLQCSERRPTGRDAEDPHEPHDAAVASVAAVPAEDGAGERTTPREARRVAARPAGRPGARSPPRCSREAGRPQRVLDALLRITGQLRLGERRVLTRAGERPLAFCGAPLCDRLAALSHGRGALLASDLGEILRP